jgi:Eukaryotic cytochrome b561
MILLQRTCRALVLATTVSMAITLFNGSFLTWHAMLMSTAYLGLMTEAVLRAISFRSLDGPERVDAIKMHASLQVACFALAAGGFWAMYQREV